MQHPFFSTVISKETEGDEEAREEEKAGGEEERETLGHQPQQQHYLQPATVLHSTRCRCPRCDGCSTA